MKHTIEELQFAATVRALAVEMHNFRGEKMTEAEYAEFCKRPLNAMLAEALQEIVSTADLISEAIKP